MTRNCRAGWGSLLLVAGALMTAGTVSGRQVEISEVMASNVTTLLDEDGDTPDWIELVNVGAEPVSMVGYGLSDDPLQPFRWVFAGGELGPGERTVAYASAKDRKGLMGAWETVVTRGTWWRYSTPSITPRSGWTTVDYDDSAWQQGPSGFGYGDDDDATILPPGTLAAYARVKFDVPDPAQLIGALLHMDWDDGFVAYLNGIEIARENMGAPGSPTSAGQSASPDHEAVMYTGGVPKPYTLGDLTSILVQGTNVLAVEVHNVSAASTDLSLIPFLTLGSDSAELSFEGVASELLGYFSASLPHTDFRLSEDEILCLTPPDGIGPDCITVPPSPPDMSFGRDPTSGLVGFFASPTPGMANTEIAYSGQAPDPVFDHTGGFYSSPVDVTISSPDPAARAAITIDGSDPPGILIDLPYMVPVSGNTVIRARLHVPGMLPGNVATHTYLFDAVRDIPTVSVSTAPANLWDVNTGIYVHGPPGTYDTNFPYFGSNFWEDWEIPVHVEWFEPGGYKTFGSNAGLQIYGGWSRGHDQKSVALYARTEYGVNSFDFPFFSTRPLDSYENLVLRNSGNDWNVTMLRDGFMQTLVRDTEIDGMAYRPTAVYLNGEYWGLLNAREKINEHYVAGVSGLKVDEIDLIEPLATSVALHGDAYHYEALLDFLATANMTTPEALEEVGRRMDLDNWIDYHIAQVFFDNRDWPGNNTKAWKPREDGGRWRWILYDTDFGFGLVSQGGYTFNTLEFATDPSGPDWPNPPWSTFVFRQLLLNGDFQRLFLNRFADFLNVHFDVDRMTETLDSLTSAIVVEIDRHASRWGVSFSSWNDEIAVMRTFARNRPTYVLQHVRTKFGLTAGLAPLTVQVAAPGGGTIRVNREHVGVGPWTGDYFAGVPVPVTAIPDEGYRFTGWAGSVVSSSDTVDVDPSGGVSLTAHFVEDALVPSDVVINEIQYHASPDVASEDWVELRNLSLEAADLTGWSLSDGQPGNEFTLAPGTVLGGAGYLVLCQDPVAFAATYDDVTCQGGWSFGFSAGGETVYLRDGAGALVDSVAYLDSDPWPVDADGFGPTLELQDAAFDNATAANWLASAVIGGTPGRRNSTATAVIEPVEQPATTASLEAWPNPFIGSVTFRAQAPAGSEAVLEVFDVLGRRLETVLVGRLSGSQVPVAWRPTGSGSGLRFVRLVVDGHPVASTTVVRLGQR